MRLASAVILALSLLLVGRPAGAAVEVEYDRDVEFAAYATFDWHPGTPAQRESVQRHLVTAIERELRSRGLDKDTHGPDLYVVTHALVDQHTLAELSDEAYWEFITGVREVDAYKVGGGTLVIDLVDPRTQDLVWRAVATEAVKGDVEQVVKKLDRVVRKMLKQYPPK